MGKHRDEVDGSDDVAARSVDDTHADAATPVPGENTEDVYVEVVSLGPVGESVSSGSRSNDFGADATPADDGGSDDDIDEQLAKIEETRTEMSETIDAIQQKLSPEAMKEQATDAVRAAAVGQAERIVSEASQRAGQAASGVVTLVTRNPARSASAVLTATAAAGVLLARSRSGGEATEDQGDTPRPVAQPSIQLRAMAARLSDRGMAPAATTPWTRIQESVNDVQQVIADNRSTLMAAVAGIGLTLAGRVLDGRREPPVTAELDANGMLRPRWLIAAALPVVAASVWGVRQMMGTGSTTSTDLVLAWLNDAYGMENALIPTLKNHAKDAKNYPHIQAKLEQHLEQTRHHAQMVKSCIERLGGSTNGLKTALGLAFGKVQGISTGPAQDEVIKDALADYAAENFEVASYTALIAAAQAIGDNQTASVCQQIRQEDQDMAHWLEQNLPTAVQETMTRMTSSTP